MVKKLSNSVSHRRLNSHPSKQERITRSDESLRVGVQKSLHQSRSDRPLSLREKGPSIDLRAELS
jgi:hypothetical protein